MGSRWLDIPLGLKSATHAAAGAARAEHSITPGRGQGRPRDGRRGQSYARHRAFFAGVLDESRRTLDGEHAIPHHGGHDLPGPPLSDDVIERLRRVLRRPAAGGPPPPYGAPPTPYGAPRTPRAAPRRSGAEVAHLILVILALVVDLAASLLDVVTSFTEGASGPVPHILSSLLFNAPLWLILGALLQSLRRRPSAFTTAACVAVLINLTASASVFRPLLEVGLILVLLIILILGVAATLSIASNRRLDGRPAGVTLAAGAALGILARFLMSLVYLAVAMTTPYAGTNFFIGPEIGPWMALWPKGVDLPPNAAWALAIASALAAAVALSVLPRSRGTRAWACLSLGALVSTALLVTLGAVPLSPDFPDYLPFWNFELRTGVAAILVGGPLLAAVSLAFLPSCRRWFLRDPLGPAPTRTEQDRSTQFGGSGGPTPAGTGQGPDHDVAQPGPGAFPS